MRWASMRRYELEEDSDSTSPMFSADGFELENLRIFTIAALFHHAYYFGSLRCENLCNNEKCRFYFNDCFADDPKCSFRFSTRDELRKVMKSRNENKVSIKKFYMTAV